jgi:hypothetical protein
MTTTDTIPSSSPFNQAVTEGRTFGDAISRAIGEYREEIARLVAAALDPQELENYGAEDAWDYLHTVIDGHAWVTYTFLAKCAVLVSDSDPDPEDYGYSSGWPSVEVHAYACMMSDCLEGIANAK